MPTPILPFSRPPGDGWLALIGGGELTFGETLDADRAWLDRSPEGPVGFLPAASGSTEYGQQLATYLRETFAREVETLPIYRARDARRGRNAERLLAMAAVYLGGGAADHLLDAIADTPVAEALLQRLTTGGTVAAIAAAAQCLGHSARSVFGARQVAGLGWLAGGVVEPNFDPDPGSSSERRLRKLLALPGVSWGVGIPAGAALLLGPDAAFEVVDSVYLLTATDGEVAVLEEDAEPADLM